MGDELRLSRQHYGSDRSFVFRLSPFNAWPAVERGGYFLLFNDAGLSIGTDASGGRKRREKELCPSSSEFSFFSGVALFLDADLASGESHECATFNNEPLTDEGFAFEIAALEIYAFVQDDL